MSRFFPMLSGLLHGVLRHPRFLVETAAVLLIALVWVAGPLVGLNSVEARVQVVIVIGMFRFVVYVVDHLLTQRRAAQLETSLRRQAQEGAVAARPDRQEELASVRRQFEKGIAALKESRLGKGLKGKAALYALPWYMFIGPPASGKSTALRHSGLQFPYLGGSGQGVQGVGGTRNCDWWFTNDAVLLDTAGRYVTHDEDQEEWLGFLDLLKKYRKEKPINGVLAAISIADLLKAGDEELEAHAKKMRTRIDELIKRLGIVFPVYLIFTKCDLVQGFVEFFEDLNRAERERVWGCTFAKSSSTDAPHVRFKSEFEELVTALQARRLPRMAATRGLQKINIFGFPLQIASARDKLTRFVEVLFQQNPYQENPFFRGFYFTSGTQEGTPIDRILSAVSRASGLSENMVSSFVSGEPKSYFLKGLFTDVIFPDQVLAGPSSALYRQRGYLRVAVFVLAVLLVIFSVTGLAISFIGNKQVINGSFAAALTVPEAGLFDEAHIEKNVDFIERLGRRFNQLRAYEEEQVPIRLWGLYRADRLFEPMRDLYMKHFHRIFLAPTKRSMEESLTKFVSETDGTSQAQGSDYYYSMLKAYIMLGDPNHLNGPYLERWLSNYWKTQLPELYRGHPVPEWVQEGVTQQMALYSRHVAREAAFQLALHRPLIHDVQRKLQAVPTVDRIYALSQREVTETLNPFTLDVALQGQQQPSLVSNYAIPGLFTFEGWSGPYRPALAKILDESGQEAWVIGEPERKREEMEQAVTRLYFDDYIKHWQAFLKSLRIRPVVTPVNTDEILAVLGQNDSPLIRVFDAVDRNTVPAPQGMARFQQTATGLIDKMKKKLGIEFMGKDKPSIAFGTEKDFSGLVSSRFKSIHYLVSVPEGSQEAPPLAHYLTELRKVHQTLRPILRSESANPDTKTMARSIVSGEPSDLVQAVKMTDSFLQNLDGETRDAILPLLIEPWVMAMRGVMDRAKADANRRWEIEVYQPCQRNIEGKYPFRSTGEDIALVDMVEFFHPQNGALWKFYQAELKPFIEEGMEQWDAKTWNGVGLPLSPEFLVALQHARFLSEGLFSKGSSDIGFTFEVYPYPPQGAAARTVSEIRLELGSQTLRYRMEPQEWHEMKWPGSSTAPGASLQVQYGNSWITKEHKDLWGFFKLLQAGQAVPESSDVLTRVYWDLDTPDTKSLRVQYDLKAFSYKNPFRPGLFEQFRCVPQL